MSQRSSPHAPAASASASSSSAATSSTSSRPCDEEQQMETIASAPSPICRLHRHALESILGCSDLDGLITALHVSREWKAAVGTMRSGCLTFPAPSAAHLLRVLHSSLVRHLGVIDVRWTGSSSAAIMAQLAAQLTKLSDANCTDDRLEAGPPAVSRPRVGLRLSLDVYRWRPATDETRDMLAALDELACELQPVASSWLSPLSTVLFERHKWGRERPCQVSDFHEANHAHQLVTQLCVRCPTLESLSTDMLTSLDDLRTISERLPQLHTLHLRLHSDELMQHITVATSAQRQAALLEGLDAADLIPDLAALCAEFMEADPADACLTVAFLPPQIRDVGLLIRQTEYDDDNQAFLQLTTAVVRSLQTLPQLTALKLDLMPWEGYSEEPVNYLAGFDWALLGELTALTSLSLLSTSSDPDYPIQIVWDEVAAIAALRQLTQLTTLDVSGFTGPGTFDIESFTQPPVAHPSLRECVLCGAGWARGHFVWNAEQCAAFRRLPMLQRIDWQPIEHALDSAARLQWYEAEMVRINRLQV